jgi:hypothetical protein
MTTSFSSSHQYAVVDDATVSLSVTIGQGALGSTLVILDGSHLVAGTGVQNFSLGLGRDIRGKTLVITSSMVAINALTSNTVSLTGGASAQSWSDQHHASAGDNVVYVCVVQFT